MSLFKRSVWMVLVAAMTGCTAMNAPVRSHFVDYPFRHDAFDFKVAWKTTSSGEHIGVDGFLENARYYQVSDIQLWVKVLDRSKKVKAEESTLLLPVFLGTGETLPFSVTLKNATLAPGDYLNFVILYRVHDDSNSASTWLSSFVVDAVTGVENKNGESRQGY